MMNFKEKADEFEGLFTENYKPLYRLALKLTGNQQDAEDVVQESFLRAYNGWSSFRGDSSPRTWLFKIAINTSYRYIKKLHKLPVQLMAEKQNRTEAEVFASLHRTSDSEEAVLAAEMREKCLEGFMRCLPARQRIAFTLHVILGLPLNDTAEIMDTTANNIKVLTHRARKFMQELMENRCALINPANPCQCHIWVAYALERGVVKKDAVKKFRPPARTPEFDRDVDILHKIQALHRLASPRKSSQEFIRQIKKVMKNKELKILS